ncbi:thioredoxin-like protein [Cubamyces lactineus]|nr:thioredoxin-like protein [Cubamyces lactineus]
MSEQKRITLYSAVDSPFPHRVRLALEEANAQYDTILIDLMNKEEWYEKKVNPAGGKVPLLVYGGPKLHPDEEPSADSAKITESIVILEFLADIFPEAHLLPADPVLRARARLFCVAVDTKLVMPFLSFHFSAVPLEALLAVLEEIQAKLPPTGFAVGDWSIADAAIAPLLVRLKTALKYNLGTFTPETAKQGLAALESPRFARLRQYYKDLVGRPSMSKTWDEDAVRAAFERRLDRFRKTGIINSDIRVPVSAR